MDREGRWTYLNAAARAHLRPRSRPSCSAAPFPELVARGAAASATSRCSAASSPASRCSTTRRATCARDGSHVDLSFNAVRAARRRRAAVVGATGTARDVTAEKARRRRAARERREAAPGGRGRRARCTGNGSATATSCTGAATPTRSAVGADAARAGRDYRAMVIPRTASATSPARRRGLASRRSLFDIEYRVVPQRRPACCGSSSRGVPLADAARQGAAHDRRLAGHHRAASASEEEVRFLAYHDTLTGLPNRRLLRRPPAARRCTSRSGATRSVARDADRPRPFQAGQRRRSATAPATPCCARRRSASPAACARPTPLARQGGDEFVVVISDLQHGRRTARWWPRRSCARSAPPFAVDGRELHASARASASSLFPADAGDGEALLRNADAAMYRAKQLGGNQLPVLRLIASPRCKVGNPFDVKSPMPHVAAPPGALPRAVQLRIAAALVALVVAAGCVLALGQGLQHVVDTGFGSGEPRLLEPALRGDDRRRRSCSPPRPGALLPDDEHRRARGRRPAPRGVRPHPRPRAGVLRGDAHRRGDLAPHQRHHAAAAGDRLRLVDVRAQRC